MSSDAEQVHAIVDDITRDSEPEGGWSRFDRDPEALAWARREVERYLDALQGVNDRSHYDPDMRKGYAGALQAVRNALLGRPGAVICGAFDERKASRIARTETT